MTVKKNPDGRRSVQVGVEVPGSPEEVWEAIASGPGISSWFMPTEPDGRVGGKAVTGFELLAEVMKPVSGIASAFVHPMGEETPLSVSLFLYGDDGVREAPEVEARLQEWLSDRFPEVS